MSKTISVLATLLLAMGGVSAQTADQTFTVRIENVSASGGGKLLRVFFEFWVPEKGACTPI